MFDKKHIDAYSNIKAPDELYEKVANAKPQKTKIYLIPLVSSLAACLFLIFGIAAFSSMGFSPEVNFNGNVLSTDSVITGTTNSDSAPASAYEMRSIATLEFPVELNIESKTEVKVSEGVLIPENGDRVQSLTLNDNAALLWEVNPTDEETEFTMTLSSFGKTQQIILTLYPDGSYTAKIN